MVAWNKLADSCRERLVKGSAVLIDGELQSRTFKSDENKNRTIVEIKAKRIQFLNKLDKTRNEYSDSKNRNLDKINDSSSSYESNSFEKLLSDEETDLLNEDK